MHLNDRYDLTAPFFVKHRRKSFGSRITFDQLDVRLTVMSTTTPFKLCLNNMTALFGLTCLINH